MPYATTTTHDTSSDGFTLTYVTSMYLFQHAKVCGSTIWRLWKNKPVHEFKLHRIVAGIINFVMLVFYSMSFVYPYSILVTSADSLGLAVYIGFYVMVEGFDDKNHLSIVDSVVFLKSMVMYYIAEPMLLQALACSTTLAFHSHTARSNSVGVLCDVFGIILYGSPLTVMGNCRAPKLKYINLSIYRCTSAACTTNGSELIF
ncbi:hypothetical protein RND81_07G049300 [Saponaria officinalis]|uniref:Uncharacterized protein n=1 Tax=Saponaria officinalis TaxID=3572 RepID=A0AAW1JMH2_SAPOF